MGDYLFSVIGYPLIMLAFTLVMLAAIGAVIYLLIRILVFIVGSFIRAVTFSGPRERMAYRPRPEWQNPTPQTREIPVVREPYVDEGEAPTMEIPVRSRG